MAENSIAGFKKLMRYAQNLAEYEQGIAEGIIDENVFVIVLEEKVAKFKGQTFDWSGADISALATKDELTNLIDELIKDEEVIAAAFLDLKAKIEEKPSVEIEVDAELSSDSENPIQNKVITAALNNKVDKADIPDEIYIGDTEPTDEKVKVWINPNEEANAIQARTSGGGTSGSGLYSIKVAEEEDGRDLSEEDKEYNASVCRKILEGTLDAPLIVSLDVLILFVSMIQVESEGVRLTVFVNDVGSITPLTIVMSADGLAIIMY